ncbi:MAG: T9SS type A sorting domain-containing protein [Bacteroidales bacterium]|nr:T9SS type A sorting domain-containing protein [Bacteroidales bacterium]
MKRATFLLNRGVIIWILLAFLICLQEAMAGDIIIKPQAETRLDITENSYDRLDLLNSVSAIWYGDVKTQAGYFTLLNIGEYGYSLNEGDPQLPVLKKLIEIPLGASVEVSVVREHFTDISLAALGVSHPVLPAQPPLSKSIDNPDDVEFIYNEAVYMTDEFYGMDRIRVTDLGVVRGIRIARLEIAPVLYNPVQQLLRVYDDIEIGIRFSGGDLGETLTLKEEMFSPFFEGIYSMLFNYKPLDEDELIMDEPVTYVIVADPMFETPLQPFIEWKTKKGFYVIEAYTDNPSVGNTTTSIKNYLKGLYQNPPAGYNPQSFVLLVGDVAQIPAFNGTAGSHVTDLYYCEYTNDIFPECYYGRFSANNLTELQPQIDKTLEYEQYLMPDPSFLDEVVMVAGADASHAQTWGNGQINYGTTYYFNAAHGLYSHTYLQPEPPGGNYSQQIRQNVSDGVTYANYTAHCSPSGWGDPSFTISHISALTNAHKYPLMVGNCCSSLEFQTTCFGEAVLRAADKGALGYIGGSNSTYWDEDFWWGVGFESISANPTYNPDHLGAYDRTFHDHGEPLDDWYVTQGQMVSAGNLAVSQAGSSMEDYYWEIYHLMGDPSLMVYFSQPPDITANYQGLMPLATTTFTVNTDPYAYVSISMTGTLHGAAVADAAGIAEVNMFDPITVPGTADVVITMQNGKPFIGTVNVASPTGPYILFSQLTIDDSNGNNNGLIDFSEHIMFDMTLQNLGSGNGTNLTATIETTDPYVTIVDGTHTWPDIPAGATSFQDDAFSIEVGDIIPDQHIVTFDLEVTDGTETWSSTFMVTLNAPVLNIGNYIVDDSNGNNNGRLDPGENADLIIDNTNEGHCEALNTIVQVSTTSNLITLNTTSFSLGTLAPGETKTAVINVTASPSAQIGDIADLDYLLESSPYTTSTIITVNIGLIVEDFESGNFSMFNWQMGGNANWMIDNVNAYEGIYCAKSGSIGNNQSSELMITVEVVTSGEISFFRKASSEDGYDFLRFFIDGVMKEEWSGEQPWAEFAYTVEAGQRTFKWEYEKDISVTGGSDCAWIDYVVFPPFITGPQPLSVLASATPPDICTGESSQLYAFASGGTGTYTFSWSPVTGLSNPNIQNPIATPPTTTTYIVTVDDGNGNVTDEVTVAVHEIPPTPVITQQGNSLVSSAVNGNQWYNSSGMIPGANSQIYYPNATEDYYVIVTSQYGCESLPSNTIHFIYTGIDELSNGKRVHIYPNPFTGQLNVDLSLNGNSQVSITICNTYGQTVKTLDLPTGITSGKHHLSLDASGLAPGIYYCRIGTSEYILVERIIRSR